MKNHQSSLTRLFLATFISATLCCPPRVSACEDDTYDEWVQGDCDTDTDCWIGHFDTFDTATDEYISSGEDQEDCTGDCCAGVDGEGVNPFHVENGNVTRKITDMQIKRGGLKSLSWTRHHNTVPAGGKSYFGGAGGWRHSWQYDLIEHTPKVNVQEYELIYPSGVHRIFKPAATGGWVAAAAYSEKITSTAEGLTVTTPGGSQLAFTRVVDSRGRNSYEMRTLTSRFGQVTQLAYSDKGLLIQVTDLTGRQLTVTYQDFSFQSGRWRSFGTVATAPDAGKWVEFAVPKEWSTTTFQYLRVLGRNGRTLNVAEVQFFAPGATVPLTGVAKGTGDAAAAFDGNPATVFQGQRGSVNLCGLDLGVNAGSTVARVRVLAAPGQENALVGIALQGMLSAPDNVSVLTKLTASDGRSVSYSYEAIADPFTSQENVSMTRVDYGDGTQAKYRYAYTHANKQPLLTEADDPRYDGPAKRIRYAYHDNETFGMIHEEINPATGGVYASLELDKSNPDKRVVNYSDLRSVSYILSKTAKNRAVERTDGLGRKTSYEYGAGGAGRLVAKTDHAGRRTSFTYDADGRLLTEQRDTKVRQQHAYDTKGNRLKTIDHNYRETSFVRDAIGLVARVKLPDGTARDFTYDSLGRVATYRQADGGLHKFAFDSQGRKTSWTNPRGGVTRYGYDTSGLIAAVTDPIGRTVTRQRNERGLVTKLTHSDGTSRQFAYDTYGRKIAETDEHGRTIKRTYDDLGRVIRVEDFAHRVTTLDYTQLPSGQGCGSCVIADKPSRIVQPDGSIIQRVYDPENRMVAQTMAVGTPAQATTTNAYDADDNLITVTDALGHVTRSKYDGEHHRLMVTDPSGRVTKWAYDDHGNLLTQTAPDGGVTRNLFDAADHRTLSTNALGQTTRFGYDDVGNLISVLDATGAKTLYTYEGKSRTAALYADGKRERWQYDAVGRIVQATSVDGILTTTTYDAGNRSLNVSRVIPNASSEATVYTYDELGHRTSTTDPLGHQNSWAYDHHGNILAMTRSDGRVVARNTYDALDNLLTTTDAGGGMTTYTYDTAGNQTSVTDANGNRYGFTYDALRRKTSMVYPDGTQEKWTYDLGGKTLTYTTRNSQTRTSIYNADNQPVSETWSPAGAASDVSFRYDSAGRLSQLLTVSSELSTLTKLSFTYDELGRVISETSDLSNLVSGLDIHTIKYGYDELGRRSDLIYPDKTKVNYTYDTRSRLISIDIPGGGMSPLAKYGYDAKGRIAQVVRANGASSTYTYDMVGQLIDITHSNGFNVLARSQYSLDESGRRTALTREDGSIESYAYDAIDQLKIVNRVQPSSASAGDMGKETFAYDLVGSRTQIGGADQNSSTEYVTNALNQYTQISAGGISTLLTYDANGNLVNDGSKRYWFDAQNRLIAVETAPWGAMGPSASVRAEFFYDGRNRCVLRKYYSRGHQGQWIINLADTRVLTYDIAWNMLAERDLNGDQVGKHIYGQPSGQILFSNQRSSTIYPLCDAVGSAVALTNEAGKVVERLRYDAYGLPHYFSATYKLLTASQFAYRQLFTGREWLSLIGLSDHRNRYYLPHLGRWLSADPIGFRGGINLMCYCSNSPAQFSDPAGLFSFTYFSETTEPPTTQTYVKAYYESRSDGCYLVTEYGSAYIKDRYDITVNISIINPDSSLGDMSDIVSAGGGVAAFASLEYTGGVLAVAGGGYKVIDIMFGNKDVRLGASTSIGPLYHNVITPITSDYTTPGEKASSCPCSRSNASLSPFFGIGSGNASWEEYAGVYLPYP